MNGVNECLWWAGGHRLIDRPTTQSTSPPLHLYIYTYTCTTRSPIEAQPLAPLGGRDCAGGGRESSPRCWSSPPHHRHLGAQGRSVSASRRRHHDVDHDRDHDDDDASSPGALDCW
eukprot:GHVU01199641.1.p2 GENE.GHVU01199641.1~~GHVU01199641.1.p2  ORF type:complete len:116 (-),score=10.46 GHVU01199641.1:986-1333(-)